MHTQLTLTQVAVYLRISEEEISKLVKFDEIPHQKRGGQPYFSPIEVDAWASRRIMDLKEKKLTQEHVDSTRQDAKILAMDSLMPSLISPEFISLELVAKTKRSLLAEMVNLANATEYVYDAPDLLRQITEREDLSSTAMPGGIAILHPHHQSPYSISDPFIVFARARSPIYFGAKDDEPTDLFCLLCCGEHVRHLHVLARLCMMIIKTDLIDQLRQAETSHEAYQAFIDCETKLLTLLK